MGCWMFIVRAARQGEVVIGWAIRHLYNAASQLWTGAFAPSPKQYYCLKLPIMKLLLAIALACTGQLASAQFAGKLTYKLVNPNDILYMVYYQNGNNARVDARTVSKSDTTQVTSTQDTLLFDIAGKKTTHLQYKTGNAYIMMNTASLTLQAMGGKGMPQQDLSVQTVGAETVNGYACTHYIVIGTIGHYTSKRDVWVTTSLGTPGIQVAGGYLYWTPDFPQEIKLLAAGGAGVIVRSSIKSPGMSLTMDLIGVDTKKPDASLFKVPARYAVVDRSQMMVPNQ